MNKLNTRQNRTGKVLHNYRSTEDDSTAADVKILHRIPEQHFLPSAANIYVSLKTATLTENRLPPILLTWMQTFFPEQVITFIHTK